LTNRRQVVTITDSISDEKYIKSYVRQGLVLGPLLFLIYINDISNSVMSFCRLYSDDTSLIFLSQNLAEIEHVINYDLEQLNQWHVFQS